MAIGTVTIGETPCCGVIERTYEASPRYGVGRIEHRWTDEGGQLRYDDVHSPDFAEVAKIIDQGICPDCKQRIRS